MKRLLFFSVMSIFCLTISAQTKTWIGPPGGNFNVAEYWSPTGIPNSDHNIILPPGSDMNMNSYGIIKSFVLQGNAKMSINAHFKISSASSISANAILTWNSGFFQGEGTISNQGVFNLEGAGDLLLQNQIILNNEGTINVNGGGTFRIGYGSPTLNNLPSGVINLKSDVGIAGGSGAGTIINTGLIKRTQGIGVFTLGIPLKNNNGTLSVESGTLKLQNASTSLTNGTYNVTTNGILEWANNLTCAGTLTGQLDGPINWTGTVLIASGAEATFDFDGSAGVNWYTGYLRDNGTLTNTGILNLEGASDRYMADQIILNNEGVINVNCTATFRIGYGSPTLNNLSSGIINLNSDVGIGGGSGAGTIVNTGIIKKETSSGNFKIGIPVNNLVSGKIIAENGLLNFTGSFEGNGIVTGNGSIGLPNATVFEGTVSPGGFPGTLTHNGNYTASTNAILATEIYGPTAGTEYDVFDVQGNAIMDGDIVMALYFAPNIGDEFAVVTANNITSCNLPATITQNHDGHIYTFDVICNPDNVTLKVTNIVLGTETNTLSNVKLFPNPSNGNFTIDLGREYTDVSVQIYNILGQLISSEKYASAKTITQQINASAGIYFVKVSTAKGESNTLRIIKQ